MNCTACGSENRELARFCDSCGAPFEPRCLKCKAPARAGARFCDSCGTPLGAPTPGIKANDLAIRLTKGSASDSLDGERKTVTALFADIMGSTELEQDLDPEEARAIIDPTLRLMIDAVQRYDGYVVQSTGDGIFAIFGAPVAHEDHPQRALYAALRMQEDLRRYSARLVADGGNRLQCRVGVNTGEVVVRSISTRGGNAEYTPIGHTANLASRMQAVAPAGSIAVAETTRKLCEGYFALKPLGPTRVKGVSEPVNVYEVTGLGALRTRLQRSAGRGLSTFVGREREMEAIRAAAQLAHAGKGQIVAAVAEAGVGKSRLFYEFKAKNQSGWVVLETLSVSHGKATVYLPLLDLLHTYFDIKSEDDARKRREKVNGKVLTLDRSLEDSLPYLFSLLGIVEDEERHRQHWEESLDRLDQYLSDVQGGDSLAHMDAQVKKRRTLEAIKRILLRESLNQPLIVIFEDLHWIDEETQAFLNVLAESIANAKILLLVNYRPEYSHSWNSKTYYTQLRLDPLGKESADEMLAALLGDSTQLGTLKRTIIERTEGNPFFMEETVQMLLDEGALVRDAGVVKLVKPLAELKIPSTVQGILAARIDRLPADEKDLLQTLAVIGKEFPLSLAREVTRRSEEDLEGMLVQLQLAEFIYEQPTPGDTEYTFKHALTRDVAYNSLLIERRKALHERTARAIEALYSERLDDHHRNIARHYLLSDATAKAIHYAQLAAEQARDRAAYAEAAGLIDAGIHLLDKLPEGEERLRAELGLRGVEAALDFVLFGASSPKRERAITRECEIAEHLSDRHQLLHALVDLSSLHWVRAESALGLKVAQRCLELCHLAQTPDLLGDVYWMAGVLFENCGGLKEAVTYYKRSLEAAQECAKANRPLSPTWGILHAIMTKDMACATLQLLGRIGEATEMAESALRQARASQHFFTLCHALLQAGLWLSFLRREPEKMVRYADELILLSDQSGFAEWLPQGVVFRGCAIASLGQLEKGVAEMEKGAEHMKRNGTVWPGLMAQLPRGYACVGQNDQAVTMLEQILSDADRGGCVGEVPEIFRIKGEVLLMADHPNKDEAESCFRSAIELGQSQEAKWWELRASTSLARLLRDTDRRDEARTILSEIYGWFTEGFDTADLKDARALLDELGA